MKNGRKPAQKKKSKTKNVGTKAAAKRKRSLRVKEEAPAYRVDLNDFVTLEAAAAATGKTTHNIRDYIQRGRIAKFNPLGQRIAHAANGQLRVSLKEIRAFLSLVDKREERHHHAGLHPELGFYDVPSVSAQSMCTGFIRILGSLFLNWSNGFCAAIFGKAIGFSIHVRKVARLF
jgi:hypothetical protein